jgi:hypothetical protein
MRVRSHEVSDPEERKPQREGCGRRNFKPGFGVRAMERPASDIPLQEVRR